MSVYLAYYDAGYPDDPAILLGIFATEVSASNALTTHKSSRDTDYEYKDRARWYVVKQEVLP